MGNIQVLETGDVVRDNAGDKYALVLLSSSKAFLLSVWSSSLGSVEDASAGSWYSYPEARRKNWEKVSSDTMADEAIATLVNLGRIVNGRVVTG